ncbi:SRPBCC family protein [Streptomyces finlayi]|uniref:SRPBCC family protein n=1 Tax=Streptomyces finlayi TaxID=67296 RepID=UPI0016747008|nr:SRPBCC family protein [Streptomyces finlayi]
MEVADSSGVGGTEGVVEADEPGACGGAQAGGGDAVEDVQRALDGVGGVAGGLGLSQGEGCGGSSGSVGGAGGQGGFRARGGLHGAAETGLCLGLVQCEFGGIETEAARDEAGRVGVERAAGISERTVRFVGTRHVPHLEGRDVVAFVRRLPHPIGDVWQMITDPARLPEWLAAADIDLRPGGHVEFRWLNAEAVARGTVDALRPPHVVDYRTDIHGHLHFELAEEAYGCRLSFVCTVVDAGEHLAASLAGWHTHLDHLAGALAGTPAVWSEGADAPMARWRELLTHYTDMLEQRR